MNNRPENHARFLSHLQESDRSVWLVAKMLRERGHTVIVPSSSKAAKHEDWQAHADDGDLYITQRIEVKRLGVTFSGAADWPFGKKFIVCARHAFDRANPKPYAFVILSSDAARGAVVFSSDSKSWYVEERTDSRYEDVRQQFYFSPMESVRFFAMPSNE